MEKELYKHHCLPTGGVPVPPNNDGEREINGWQFNYQGWSEDGNSITRAVQKIKQLKLVRHKITCFWLEEKGVWTKIF
jgi:hypothetical protein